MSGCCDNCPCDFGVGCATDPFATYNATLYDDINGSCPCIDGLVIPLTYDIPTQTLNGTATACDDNGCQIAVTVECQAGGPTVACGNCNNATPGTICASASTSFSIGGTCAPLNQSAVINWQDSPSNPCGEGHMCCGTSSPTFHIVLTN